MRVRSAAVVIAALLVLASATPPARAQQPPPGPFAPDWGMVAGWTVYADKGCGRCHAVRGVGGDVGPDLSRMQNGGSFFDIGAAMWNHVPKMGERMRAAGIERARLTPAEAANLIAFIYTAQYFDRRGDPGRGEPLFTTKACVTCHSVGGEGGVTGPALDPWKRANSPVLLAAAMWNHAPRMAEELRESGTKRPVLSGAELLDIIAYVGSAARTASTETQQVVPGTPERGRVLFAEKRCASCHAVGGRGPRVGPDLGGRGHHVSLTEFAARMWNHAPGMTAKMRQMKIDVPEVSGQQMADILAYLFASRYFERGGSAVRGERLVQSQGCISCHSIAGKGGTIGGDFAKSTVVATPSGLVAGLWNHAPLMEAQAAKQRIAWPELSGPALADLAAYFRTLSRPGRSSR